MPLNYLELFNTMVDKKASRMHLIPGSPIMLRSIDSFAPMDPTVLMPQDTASFAEEILSAAQKEILKSKKELNFTLSVPGLSRFRVNIFTQRGSIAAVIMTNPPKPPTMDELGIPEGIRTLVSNLRSGLVIISGSRGSGKSSTMAAILNHILEMRSCQVVTLENPIDFLFRNRKGVICQREVGTDTESYETAFKSLMHQGADVLAINEFNSYEIARNILNLSAGGMLVLAIASSPSVLVLLEQLVDLYPPHLKQQAQTLLSVSLEAIISQTLLNRAQGGGLVPAFEICIGNGHVRNLLREGKIFQIQSVIGTTGREVGMISQEQALRGMVKKNLVTQDEAISKAARPEEFKKMLSLPY
ncbi:MAG: ATPase, T2SS/T4P/T4SS family [bacterium]